MESSVNVSIVGESGVSVWLAGNVWINDADMKGFKQDVTEVIARDDHINSVMEVMSSFQIIGCFIASSFSEI